jgi:hypothetical protein
MAPGPTGDPKDEATIRVCIYGFFEKKKKDSCKVFYFLCIHAFMG